MPSAGEDRRVVAIDPTSRGFGYAILEGPTRLIDWGVTEGLRADNRDAAARVEALLARYEPDAIVVEDVGARRSRRCQRVRALVREVSGIAEQRDVNVHSVSTDAVRRMFSSAEATNKEQIADTITGHFSELAPWRPPFRKPWMSEDARMAIFDAVAFALTHFYFEEERPAKKAA